jgi:hypothetical protein
MNAKLQSALNRVWNEPRGFFFSLAFAGALGWITAGALSAGAGLNIPLFLVAVCSILGVLVALPAFILAWIPPIRRLLSWLLGRRFTLAACVAVLVALFYAVEDFRGWRAWKEVQRDAEAHGERLDLASIIPPNVPKEQNFFETPLWEDLRREATNSAPELGGEDREESGILGMEGPHPVNPPGMGSWARGQRADLAAWQGYYRGESNRVYLAEFEEPKSETERVFRRRYGAAPAVITPTNYFPTTKEAQAPAADVLLALSRFQEKRALLIAAASRPQSRFCLNYDARTSMRLPHLGRIRAAAQYLSLHASAALNVGQTELALEDLRLSFRLPDSVRREPRLLPHFVRMEVLRLALQPVWEGLADRRWTAADLEVIERELGKLDFLTAYGYALKGELVCIELPAVDYIHKQGVAAFDCPFHQHQLSLPDNLKRSVASAVFLLTPSGWFDQNKAALARVTTDYLVPVVDVQRRIVSPAVAMQSEAALVPLGRGYYDALLKQLLHDVVRTAHRFAYAQGSVDLARVACALERYRLEHGEFPDRLEALAPKFIDPLPHDPINGEAFKYRRTGEGRFILYSVGWNGKDDGGMVAFAGGGPDAEKGDWVWRYSVK